MRLIINLRSADAGFRRQANGAMQMSGLRGRLTGLSVVLALSASGTAFAGAPTGSLETMHRHTTVTSTVPANGDQNPYALIVAPVSSGKIHQGDVLIDNFNDKTISKGLVPPLSTTTPRRRP